LYQHSYFNSDKTPDGSFDFNSLNIEELDKSVQIALDKAYKNVADITEQKDTASFKNTIVALETSDEDLDKVLNVLFNLFGTETNEKVQNLVEKYSPLLSAYSNSIVLNDELFKRVEKVFKEELDSLKGEDKKLTEKYYKDFIKNGAELSKKDKELLKDVDSKLSGLSPQFSKNSLDATNSFSWTTTDLSKLKGLPESALNSALAEAKQKEMPEGTYLFTLQHPSLLPILKYCEDRSLREHFYKANSTKAVTGEHSNQKLIKEIVTLRSKKAKLLGFKNYAEFVLQNRMARSTETVFNFLNDLKRHSLSAAKKEVEEVKKFAKEKDGLEDFQAWDFSYYSEKLRQERFSFSEEEIRPYFPLDKVLNGAFLHAEKLYDVEFKKTTEVSTYNPEVDVYNVFSKKDQSFIGLFFTDFFPRSSKRSGAWCTHFRSQGLTGGEIKRPHVSIVCNFTKPTEDKPSLLTFNETRTLFHEFGHALHELLSQCTYTSLSGTNVYWDFVELPSQIMENWVLEEESLNLFARHYETDEVIPKDYVTKIKNAESFLSGYGCVRQLRFATLDMLYHTLDPEKITDVIDFENEATKEFNLLPTTEGTNFSCSFGHIFAGGYAAGYYSYKWAEVLDADAFELFKEKGIFNKEVALSFKENILERGGTDDPDQLYINFRGQKPDTKALLKRDKLIN